MDWKLKQILFLKSLNYQKMLPNSFHPILDILIFTITTQIIIALRLVSLLYYLNLEGAKYFLWHVIKTSS